MTTVYIKFRHKNDVYAIDPFYEIRSAGELIPPLACGRCGNTLFIPVDLPEGIDVSQSMGDVYRPFPREAPHLVSRGDPELPTLEWNKPLGLDEQRRLKQYHSMVSVGSHGFAMFIEDIRTKPSGRCSCYGNGDKNGQGRAPHKNCWSGMD